MTNKFTKILAVTLLIICFTSTLFGCTNSNEVTDNNETTTTADNKTTEPTTTETPTTTEEPTTEETSTEYVFKGYEFAFNQEGFELKKDLIINPGDFIYINEYVPEVDEYYDLIRGTFIRRLLTVTQTENGNDLTTVLMDKYMEYGDSAYYIPHADNYSFEYVGDKSVIFKFIKYNEDGEAVYDVYKE